MTTDLQRLCQAAEEAFETVFHGDAEITPGGSETIVRAVLLALKDASNATIEAGVQERNRNGAGSTGLPLVLRAMIDHVLAEPADPQVPVTSR
ncbi:hypothetical protein [Methylobacterium sp. J-070]|uniref:hypothetical protein n=1 Tax=Methylobacterium sp. J-070 TaxID=2836650 RepID=UPI001FBB113F|nr:hypothetical protein [Methylobacterium sp. J-070]MCJ2053924.1 hypothetical protein [Methylobacterium sp. J-070]